MGCLGRRPEPAAIDITWVSCRGVRSSLPFHTPCLYASVCVTPSSARKNVRRRPVKTPTDRAGGENPEWDERLRLRLPDDASSEQEAASNKKDRGVVDRDDGVLLVRFELKAEVAVLGDVLAASAVVPLSDLVADGRTRRVSYQLTASADGRQHNGVISFSYAFHHGSTVDDDEEDRSSDGEPVSPASPAPPPPPPQSTVSSSGMYPVMDWGPLEQLAVYPPQLNADTVTCSSSPEPIAVYPPLQETSSRGIYPKVGEPESSMYPTVDFAPVSCYTPTTAPYYYGGGLYG
ncbi:hypothetical protein D1007_21910 [Hordeum vulgare]|nr:hypothetical protein D1007_21910 [Hordeum vulgare]